MNRFALLLAMLPILAGPAYCAPVALSAGPHAASLRGHAHRKPACHAPAAAQSVHDDEQVKPVALTGRLIYEELGLPPPPTLDELQMQSEEHGETTPPVDQPELKMLEPKYDSTVESRRSPTGCWTFWLKTLSSNLVPSRPGERSWVSDINSAQSSRLAEEVAAFLSTQAPTQSTTLLLAPPPKAQAENPFTVALTDSLRKCGFGLADSKRQTSDAQVLRYQVSGLDGGVFVQLQFAQKQTNQYYGLGSSNDLVAGAPLCVREVR